MLEEQTAKRLGTYTLNVLSVEPVAIKVPRGFQEIDRKLKTALSVSRKCMI
jgi:hypothetical protein